MKPWERRLRLLPVPLKSVLKMAADPFDRLRVWLWRRRHRYQRPLPGLLLRTRVGAGLSIQHFVESGQGVAEWLLELFAEHRHPLESGRRVLDFGCGSGRVLAHLPGIDGHGPEIVGCDVDSGAVRWLRRHFPAARFEVNGLAPPLPFPDNYFDRVYSISILTHLTEDQQDAWLAEIDRVLAPDGVAVLTVNGIPLFHTFRSGQLTSHSREFSQRLTELPDLGESNFLFVPYEIGRANRQDFPGIDETYGLTFHHPAYVARHWPHFLDVVAHVEGFQGHEQDRVVVRKRRVRSTH